MSLPESLDEPVLNIPEGAFMGSARMEGTLFVETSIDDPAVVDQDELLDAWEELSPVSVEAAIAGRPGLFDFVNNHCLLFAAVRTPIKISLPPLVEVHNLGLPDVTSAWSTGAPLLLEDPFAFRSKTRDSSAQLRKRSQKAPKDEQAEASSSSSSVHIPLDTQYASNAVFEWKTIGVVYVTTSPVPGEVHVGVALLPPHRGRGRGMLAAAHAVQWAVETIGAHRVQARIMSSDAIPPSDRAQRLFTALGFAYEGLQRRVVPDATGAWADVTHMGITDVDWIVRWRARAAPRDLWDELFERHQREREELLRWEEHQGAGTTRMRRTASMETVRMGVESDFEMFLDAPSTSSSSSCGETRAPSPSLSAGSHGSHPHGELDEALLATNLTWRSPCSYGSSDLDDPFSDSERVGSEPLSDVSRFSEEPVSRPQSAASWSSFESIEPAVTSSSAAGSAVSGWVKLAVSRG